MDPFGHFFAANPLLYLELAFAAVGSFGFLVFIRGFFSGIGHVIAHDGHDDHMEHYRIRAVWGFCIMLYTYLAWEILRFIAGGFT